MWLRDWGLACWRFLIVVRVRDRIFTPAAKKERFEKFSYSITYTKCGGSASFDAKWPNSPSAAMGVRAVIGRERGYAELGPILCSKVMTCRTKVNF